MKEVIIPESSRDVRPRTLAEEETERAFLRAGHPSENRACNHAHYNFKTHGRYCTCGTIMVDFGD